MAAQRPFLYRGTTVGWPGNDVLQQLGLTPTTEDPIVATLFALWSTRYGEAIVQACELNAVIGLIGPSNWKSQLEREVVIEVPPFVFTRSFVIASAQAHAARNILAEMGYELAPGFVDHNEFLLHLNDSPRLSDQEIEAFDDMLLKRG
jgi:filamentous hemagglutinin